MENRAYALAAGLFTLLLGSGVFATAVWFSGETVDTGNYLLVSRHALSGLNPQAPVRFRGVTVGKVVSIDFDPLEPRSILVEITVRTGTPLSRGTYAQLGSQGVTGLSYVILDDDGSKPEPLAAEGDKLARIEVRPSFIDSVSASGQELLDSYSQVAKRVNSLLSEENQRQLASTLRNLDQASGKVAALATSLEPAVKALEPTVKAIEPAVKALPALAVDAGAAFRRADALLANLNQRVESFERAARSAEHLSIQGVAVSETMLNESLPRFNMLIEDLQRSSRGLERLLSEINEQPHSIVFGKNPLAPGPGEPGFALQRVVR
ncbi:MAG: MCE family protein [Betaproteobacteria bacterium]|nr:MCE family protein [Betaproteobacteria bacterium]MBI2223579.1 MCE family protein [Betaproteobacteria bacterium]